MLTSLPTELVELIAGHLSLPDFRLLRLVCSSLVRQLQHLFNARFFQQHTLSWTVAGFKTLHDISEREQLQVCLRRLIVVATPVHQMKIWALHTQSTESDDPAAQLRLKREEAICEEEAMAIAKHWNESRHDYTSLIAIFAKLTALESIVFAYDGMPKALGKFGRAYCARSTPEMSRPFVITMAVMAETSTAIKSITIHQERKYGAVGIGRLESLSPTLPKLQVAFDKLQVLQLNLRDWRHPELGFEPPEGRIPFVVRFLSKCNNLRRFEVSCFSSLEDNIFSEMAKHCRFPHLEHCELALIRLASMDDLFSFLEPAKDSLRSMSLSHMVLRDETAAWPDLMRRVANSLDLDSFQLQNAFGRMGARVGVDGTIKGTLSLHGRDLKEQLEYHADRLVVGNWGPAWHLASIAYPFIGLRT